MSRELRAAEYTAASLPDGSVGRVVSAQYGKGDVWADVTELVARHVTGAGGLPDLRVDNTTMGSDPVHGTVKELIVKYAPPEPRCAAGDVPLKVQIKRGHCVKQYRRVCLTRPSFTALQSVMRWWVSGDYKIQYVDPDGDDVTVCSQAEWEECLRLWEVATSTAPAPLRLACMLPKLAPPPDAAPERARARGCASAGCPHAAHSESAPWNGDGKFCCHACMKWGGLKHGGRCQRRPQPGAAPFTVQADVRGCGGGVATADDERRAAVQQDIVSAVLDRQHGPHALQRLSTGNIDGAKAVAAAGGWLKVRPASGGCDLDIDVVELGKQLHRSGMAALDGGAHDDAMVWFTLQSQLCPGNAAAAYNLACAAALLGKADRAFDALHDALFRGYDDAAHLLQDPDLASLHGDGRWQAAVDALTGAAGPSPTAPPAPKCVKKQVEKEAKKQEKEARKEEKKQEKEAKKEEKKQEKEAKKEEKKQEKEAKKEEKKQEKEAKKQDKEAKKEEKKQEKVTKKELKKAVSDSGSDTTSTARTASPATEVEGVVVAAEPPVAEHPRFAAQLRVLHAMGLSDDGRNVAALERAGGDVQRAIPSLLD